VSITTDLDAIRARADAATAGPWAVEVDGGVDMYTGEGWRQVDVCIPESGEGGAAMGDHELAFEDATFIAHARTDVPFLLDLVDELRRQVKVWKGKAQ